MHNFINIQVYLFKGVSPFTRISGNRYLPFFDKEDVNINDKELVYINQNFWPVSYSDYTFSQTSLMDGVLRIGKNFFNQYINDPLVINYCLIKVNNKNYYYFIEKARYTQNDTVEYILYLDTFATYFRYVNWDLPFKVNRTTFNILSNNYFSELKRLVLFNKDDSIGDIPLSKTYISYQVKGVDKDYFKTKKYYAYVIPNANTIEQNVMFKQPLDEGYLIDVTDKKNRFNKETSDNQIFYEIVGGDLGDDVPKEIIKEQVSSFSVLMKKLKSKNKERPQFTFYLKPSNPNNMRSRINLILNKVTYKGKDYINRFNLFWGYHYGINISAGETKVFDGYDIKDTEFIDKWYKSGIMKELKEELIYDGEGNSNFVRLNQDFTYVITQDDWRIPVNNQLTKIGVYNWFGEKIDLNPSDVLTNIDTVELTYYGMAVMSGFDTYLSFKNTMLKSKFETYDNVVKFTTYKKVSHRTDSKQEFLQSQRNTIEAQKSNLLASFLGGMVNNLITNVIALASSGGGVYKSMAGGELITGTINGAIKYSNSIKMINAKIADSGLQRSSVSDETTGSLEKLINETYKYNRYGWTFMYKVPDATYTKILANHYNKFGYQIDSYFTLREVMVGFHKERSKLRFQYIKSDDFASLQPQSIMPQEAFEDLNSLISNGVHIWFVAQNLDYFEKNYPDSVVNKYIGEIFEEV